MDTIVYDMPIGEVANILVKSDRQVRRYVKAKRLRSKPVRIGGHLKLMFNKEQVIAFKESLEAQEQVAEYTEQIIADTHLINDTSSQEKNDNDDIDEVVLEEEKPVKYVIDVLKEQINDMRKDNKDLHYQLEQRSGQVGFLQGKVETLEEEVKMLAPVPKPEEEKIEKSWWQRFWSSN